MQQAQNDRYQEGVSFFQLGGVATELGQIIDGPRLMAVTYVIDQEIGHSDTEQDWRNLTDVTEELAYSQQQVDALVEEVRRAYLADRGQGLLQAAFGDASTKEAQEDTLSWQT